MSAMLFCWVGLILAAVPGLLFVANLFAYRRTRPWQKDPAGSSVGLSVLIPARNEELNITAALQAVLASTGVDFEIIVLDDHSTDRTGALVDSIMLHDPRVRKLAAPPLPPGWCGKQFASAVLARQALYSMLVFIDADVRLKPDALARLAQFMQRSGADLASGVPRQETGTVTESLLLPLIHFLLLGFLPIFWMRRTGAPAFGAGCGQLFIARADSYRQCGGHAAIAASLHDGLGLPRSFRRAGLKTDLFDATDLAQCRMYDGGFQVWQGLSKNAIEGLGSTPALIGPMTLILLGGQVMPWGLAAYCLCSGAPGLRAACAAIVCGCLPRALAAWRFAQPGWSVLLHPLGVLALVGIQWSALARSWRGQPAVWKGRPYSASRGQPGSPGALSRRRPWLAFWLLPAILGGLWPGLAAPGSGTSRTNAVPGFTLEDQFRRAQSISFPREKVLLLAVADRKGSSAVDDWIKPIFECFGREIDIAGVADMSAVPPMLRTFVRTKFSQQRAFPVMIDWQGSVTKSLGGEKNRANIFVVDRSGRLAGHWQGRAEQADVAEILKTIRELIAAAKGAKPGEAAGSGVR